MVRLPTASSMLLGMGVSAIIAEDLQACDKNAQQAPGSCTVTPDSSLKNPAMSAPQSWAMQMSVVGMNIKNRPR